MKRLSMKLARRWAHEVACWLEYARVMWGIGNKRIGYVGKNLRGACWIASYILVRKLASVGVRAGIVFDAFNRHAFVTTECGWTSDATFGQFADDYGFRANVLVTRERIPCDYGSVLPSTRPHTQTINRILRRMGVVP